MNQKQPKPKRNFLKMALADPEMFDKLKTQLRKHCQTAMARVSSRRMGKTQSAKEINIAICKSLGLDSNNIISVNIKIRGGEYPIIEVTYFNFENPLEPFTRILEIYELNKKG